MAIFEIEGPDGKVYEVEAPDLKSAASAMKSFATPPGGSRTNSAAVDQFKGKMDALLMGAHNGGFMGWGDNLQGVKSAVVGQSLNDGVASTDFSGSMGERYTRGVDQYRQMYGQAEAENPLQVGAGNILGASGTAMAAAPFATGATTLGNMGRGALIGGIEGALQFGGNADGEDVAGQMGRGALVGGGLGLAAPAIVAGIGAIKNAVKDPATGVIDGVLGRANSGKANRAIGDALRASGKTRDEINEMVMRALRDGQPEYRMVDALGVPGQRQASGIARAGGDAAAEITDFLEKRQISQGDRVGGFIEDAFGFRGNPSGETLPVGQNAPPTPSQVLSGPQRTAAKTKASLEDARREAADINYTAARNGASPVDVRSVVSVIDERLGPTQGNEFARDGIDGTFQKYRDRLIRETPDGAVELSDFNRVLNLKQDLQTEMKGLIGTPAYSELKKIEQAIDQALEGASEKYRLANDTYREASRVVDSVEEGAFMSGRGRADDNVSTFGAMNPDMQAAARIGYGDDLLNKLERVTAPTSNRAKPLQSFKRETEADAIAIDPALYRDRLSRENDMWNTQNRALGGSRTADNEADKSAMESLAGGTLGAVRSAANVQFGDAVAKIAGMVAPLAKGQNDATRQLIARALMSKDPVTALAPVIKQQSKSEAQRRVIEAILRNASREGIAASMK
jgi:hypothetical protein